MYEVTITKGTTTWKVHRPEQSLKWLAQRMKANGVKNTPKFKGLKKLKRKATQADIQVRERTVEIFLGQLVGAVGVGSIAFHAPLRSWLEIDEEGRHGKSKLVSGINERAVCVVKALQDYTARDDRELSFAADEIISIVDDSHPDWWKAKMGSRVGLVPASMLELVARTGPGKVLSKSEQIGNTASIPEGKELICAMRAIADFDDPDPKTLSFSAGEVIAVTQQDENGWWEGLGQSGKSGWFPSTYVESLNATPTPKKISEAARLELELSGYYDTPAGASSSSSSMSAPAPRGPPSAPPPPAAAADSYSWDNGGDAGGYDYANDNGANEYDYGTVAPDSKALYDYTPTADDQIALREGELIVFEEDYGDGWSAGTNEAGEYGLFPTSYVDYL